MDRPFAYSDNGIIAHIVLEGSLLHLKIHIVKDGDTLYEIAKQYGVTLADLEKVNPEIKDTALILRGMKIKIPQITKIIHHEEKYKKELPKSKIYRREEQLPKGEAPLYPIGNSGLNGGIKIPVRIQRNAELRGIKEEHMKQVEMKGHMEQVEDKGHMKEVEMKEHMKKVEEKEWSFYRRPIQEEFEQKDMEYNHAKSPEYIPHCAHCYQPIHEHPKHHSYFPRPKNIGIDQLFSSGVMPKLHQNPEMIREETRSNEHKECDNRKTDSQPSNHKRRKCNTTNNLRCYCGTEGSNREN